MPLRAERALLRLGPRPMGAPGGGGWAEFNAGGDALVSLSFLFFAIGFWSDFFRAKGMEGAKVEYLSCWGIFSLSMVVRDPLLGFTGIRIRPRRLARGGATHLLYIRPYRLSARALFFAALLIWMIRRIST